MSAISSFSDDPYSDENLADPYPLFERMRAAGPAVWLERYDVLAFTRHTEVRDILVDHETFINGAGVGPKNLHKEPAWRPQGILESDPPMHGPMRAAMVDVISPRGVRSLRAGFQEFAEELLDRLIAQGEFDAITEVAEVFPIRAFGDAVGIPREGRMENLLPHGAMNFSTFGPEDDRYREYFAKGDGTRDWVMANCARENLSTDGLGSKIWEHADAGAITSDQAALLVRALLSAGLDTTALAIGNTLRCLSGSPEAWQAVHEKPSLMKFAIDEALRFESPFQSFFRTTSRATEFHGIQLDEGQKVLVFPGAANRDPAQWGEDADEYRMTRQAGGHLAFGMGIHQCVGQPISRLEMDVLLTTFATRVKRIERVGEPVPYLHNTLKGLSSLPLKVIAA
ncbi:cytochrome P450 [Salinibacterium sp. M195]|uniref:cytochrome P450 n=1 Tax=Salinibacterium sp. M195 TaxID=2583374 RepID=UPI001C63836E|nr:cytochrome P450 [Salinibacterium sp. M195]QYH35132.1 cytochrome P450 [Salinibacterium sp. M195]